MGGGRCGPDLIYGSVAVDCYAVSAVSFPFCHIVLASGSISLFIGFAIIESEIEACAVAAEVQVVTVSVV